MPTSLLPILLLVGSYLMGSIPFGYIVVRLLKGVDIRTLGSGNIGMTNVWRICGKGPGLAVFLLDVLKGALPPLLASQWHLSSLYQVLAGLFAIIGHNYCVWLGFRGGKGIATSAGALIGIAPKVILPEFAVFFAVLLAFRYVSLASISIAIALPIWTALFYPHDSPRLFFSLAAGLLALYRHKPNMQRLRAGTEPRVPLRIPKRSAATASSVDDATSSDPSQSP
ncbi:glycerol-3-phosphate 1-O-acyltransferase PlsY [Chthonomonas calidirosea]|uniref:glycerol-3-phosphate 1-O-acyltransferase PlsY n=1 Tax=Chthonomonas calidirosea TaxID=454171 RepID=UPI0006EC4C57|nr:glycerol-3-phosphate 1-O-acyltransferase PlsY [Chthonomonas calidirosea]CEK13428.1 acyl-phosphate glycerol-3-phosphate acyltransferase [Chthonomonas calidirosea]